MKKKRMPEEAYNADFPARQTAIRVIEIVIEPLLGLRGDDKGLEGEEYYKIEDELTAIIANYEV